MKIVIDVPEKVYNRFCRCCRFPDEVEEAIIAITDGTPLTEVLDDIKAEIFDLDYLVDSAKYSDSETRCHNVDYLVSEILKIIDRHISEERSEE